jgi:tetratricopeptide (TPR) repeat protein
LDDLDEVNVFEPNNALILQNCGIIKNMLKDYQKALEDLDKVNVLDPENAITLQRHTIVEMQKPCWMTIKDL